MSCRLRQPLRVLTAFFLLAFAMGCGPQRHSVSGRVTYEDGSPVEEGTVIGEATIEGAAVGVQGNIAKSGDFSWGGDRAGDGALAGSYRVVVMPRALGDSEKAEGKTESVDSKFSKYDSSGITFEVKPGKNELNIKVTKPKPKTNDK